MKTMMALAAAGGLGLAALLGTQAVSGQTVPCLVTVLPNGALVPVPGTDCPVTPGPIPDVIVGYTREGVPVYRVGSDGIAPGGPLIGPGQLR